MINKEPKYYVETHCFMIVCVHVCLWWVTKFSAGNVSPSGCVCVLMRVMS